MERFLKSNLTNDIQNCIHFTLIKSFQAIYKTKLLLILILLHHCRGISEEVRIIGKMFTALQIVIHCDPSLCNVLGVILPILPIGVHFQCSSCWVC